MLKKVKEKKADKMLVFVHLLAFLPGGLTFYDFHKMMELEDSRLELDLEL